MKRLTVLILALIILLPLNAGYSPSFTVSGGIESLDFKYNSMRTRVDISLLSFNVNIVTLSLPLSISRVSESTTNKGLLSPEHYKNGIGLEILLAGEKAGGSASFYYGYEHFTDENAMMRYMEAEIAAHLILEKHIQIVMPLSYTYTPEGNEYSLSLAVRIGGEI